MNDDDKINRKYEIAFVLRMEDASVISQALRNYGFEILKESPVAKIRLAYPIKKETQAYFSFVNFGGNPSGLDDLTKALKLEAGILRFLIVLQPLKAKADHRIFGSEAAADHNEKTPSWRENEDIAVRAPFKKSATVVPAWTNEALEKRIEEMLQ